MTSSPRHPTSGDSTSPTPRAMRGLSWRALVWGGAFALIAAAPGTTLAESPASVSELVTLDILPGWTTEDGTRMAAFRLRLAPGWKTYWRAPGDAGIPPRLSLAGSENVATVAMNWPVPEVFDQAGMRSIGYADGVIVPIELTPDGSGEIRLAGTLDIGVCHDICVPAHLAFDLVMPPEGARDGQIVAALIDRPLTESEAGVGEVTCTLTPLDRGIAIDVAAQMPALGANEAVVIEAGNAEIWVSEPRVARLGGLLTAEARMIHADGGAFAVDRSAVRITVIADGQAVDIRGCSAE